MRIETLMLAFSATLAATVVAEDPTPARSIEPRLGTQVAITKLLEQANRAGKLPAGVVLRVESDLRQEDEESHFEFQEAWEFTATQVHKIVREKKDGELTYRRTESRPFDSKRLCKDLGHGKILEIQQNKGLGKPLHFARTDFEQGMRAISIFVDGKLQLQLAESCVKAGYKEPHAIAFAALYESLPLRHEWRLSARGRATLCGRATL